jgi:hypothetical protein
MCPTKILHYRNVKVRHPNTALDAFSNYTEVLIPFDLRIERRDAHISDVVNMDGG